MLIPTHYKTSLSREYSYPVGAELVSEHLSGVPHFSDFRICFSDLVTAWKSKFQKMLAEGADYAIVKVCLWEPFEIFIYPVRRQFKHEAQEKLRLHGLPMLREWMVRHSPANLLRVASCRVMFSPRTQTVYLKERVAGKERSVPEYR